MFSRSPTLVVTKVILEPRRSWPVKEAWKGSMCTKSRRENKVGLLGELRVVMGWSTSIMG